MQLTDISILDILPINIARDPGVIKAAIAFDQALQEIIFKIPDVALISRAVRDEIVEELLYDLLAHHFHVDFYDLEEWDQVAGKSVLQAKRELVLKSLEHHSYKGTPRIVEEVLDIVLPGARVEEWFEYGGNQYCIQVITEGNLPDMRVVYKLVEVIMAFKNTRSWLEVIKAIKRAQITQLYLAAGVLIKRVLWIERPLIGYYAVRIRDVMVMAGDTQDDLYSNVVVNGVYLWTATDVNFADPIEFVRVGTEVF